MKKHFLRSPVAILSGFALFLISCSLGSCFEETESYIKASLYNYTTEKLTAPDSVSLKGSGLDSLIYKKKTGLSIAMIPLNSSDEVSRFVIKINNVIDSIEFRYSSYPHLISKECGYTFYHHLDTAIFTENIIKRISIENKNVTNLNGENIRIYY